MNLIYGKEVARSIEDKLKNEVETLKRNEERLPKLVVILVGDDPASHSYVGGKEKACARVGFLSSVIRLDKNESTQSVLDQIKHLNQDTSVDGILVQLPLPKHMNTAAVLEALDPKKDVDGLHPINVAKLYANEDGFVPCTPKGIMTLLDETAINIQGLNAVVIGRSALVGRPIAQLLLNQNATVTVCHSKTKDIKHYTQSADLIVCAIGKPNFIDETYLRNQAIIIDVGINRVGDRLVGDVDFESVKDHCSYLTPVPGGVGPMTIASLLENTFKAYTLHRKESV